MVRGYGEALVQAQQKRGGSRPEAAARVYAMTRAEAVGLGNLVIGFCVIVGKSCCVLFDSRATYFFVSGRLLVVSGGELRE